MYSTSSYDPLSAILGVIAIIVFNPLVWLVVIVLLIVRHDNKKKAALRQQANSSSLNPASSVPSSSVSNTAAQDDTTPSLLEEMALNTTDEIERDVLQRAAYSLRHKLHYLVPRSAYRKQTQTHTEAAPSSAVAHSAPTATPAHTEKVTPPSPPAIPLSERGLQALQNINVLLYLGAFFVVVAASIFAATTSQAIGAGGQIVIMGLVTAAFFLTGLGLYRYTDRIKPAGVTFTAIGLLLAPLVGVAAQSLLFAGRNPAPVWLVTSAVMLIMQVIAFATIRQTYIAYFASLTTISLFQSLLATAKAELFWFGWVLLITAMVYAIAAKFFTNRQISQPLEIVAQVFVPLSVLLAVVSWPIFGIWHVGVQLLLAATFYLICMALRDFDASDSTQIYLWIAASLLPAGLTLTLTGRKLPAIAIYATLWVIAIAYVAAEKYALHDRHRQVYEWISSIMVIAGLALLADSPYRQAWAWLAATGFHALHYLITRRRLSYGLFLATLSITPLGLISAVVRPTKPEIVATAIYTVMAVIAAPIAQKLWQRLRRPNYALVTRLASLLWLAWAIISAIAAGSAIAGSITLIVGGIICLYYALSRHSWHLVITAVAWNTAVITLAFHFDWPRALSAVALLAVSGLIYACRWQPRLEADSHSIRELALASFGLAFMWGLLAPGWSGKAAALTVAAVTLIIALAETDFESLFLGTAFAYAGIIGLGASLTWGSSWTIGLLLLISLATYSLKPLRPRLAQEPGFTMLYGFGLAATYAAAFVLPSWPNIILACLVIGSLVALSYRESEEIASALAWLCLLGIALLVAHRAGWWMSPSLLATGLMLYGYGSIASPESRRAQLARWVGIVGTFATIGTNSVNTLPSWLPVAQNYTAGALSLAESSRMHWRPGKYLASAVIWLVTLQAYNAAGITASQVYMQTTAAYFAALAYRFYQRGEKQTQDILTATALGFATIPLAFQALGDQTGGYVLGILGVGIAILLIGLASHYALVRTWGIATLVIITLYKTAGSILQLPAWVWFGVIGLSILAGAIYLLSRRHDEPKTK